LGLNATEYEPLPTFNVSTTTGAANTGAVRGATIIKAAVAIDAVARVIVGIMCFLKFFKKMF
jgi:hypothetical protein